MCECKKNHISGHDLPFCRVFVGWVRTIFGQTAGGMCAACLSPAAGQDGTCRGRDMELASPQEPPPQPQEQADVRGTEIAAEMLKEKEPNSQSDPPESMA